MLVSEQLDFYTFYNQMFNEEYDKNLFYLFQSGLTTLLGVPITISECGNTDKQYEIYELGSAFLNTLMQLMKLFIYLDTALNFGL